MNLISRIKICCINFNLVLEVDVPLIQVCLIYLTDFIRKETDQGNYVGMLLLDLQKAFDTVDHSILIMKLSSSGLGKDIVRWLSSYLSDRQQLVNS